MSLKAAAILNQTHETNIRSIGSLTENFRPDNIGSVRSVIQLREPQARTLACLHRVINAIFIASERFRTRILNSDSISNYFSLQID